ncbi:ATP-binding protein [Bifidobacterium sp. MA2]|uniref:ATP-binding protein n=1 Tax=Bifidobacterium santillanense TaxID=2809028 RepID=A0ABS5ULT0_9BIFI|nr:ATP-binding protein [Bifidobacterium santillanense]
MSGNIDSGTLLDGALTFDTFVPGDCNRFARTAALAVADDSGQCFNPLYIYGGSGVGKTHLLHAIGNYAIARNPTLKVRYVTAGDFSEEFVEAQSQRRTAEFSRCYRNLDILLVDDVQSLIGEDDALEQFRRTFCTLSWANKSIVVASDVAPWRLDVFGSDLVSRLQAGLAVDVKAPDRDTLVRILRMYAVRGGWKIPDGVFDLIGASCEVPTNMDRFMELTRTTLFEMKDRLRGMNDSLNEIRGALRNVGGGSSKYRDM